MGLLEEISDRLKKLTPSRTDLHLQLDRSLDIDLLKQQIHFKAIDSKSFFKTFNVIWQKIRDFHQPCFDSAWDAWKSEQEALFQDPSCTWSTLLPPMFNEFLQKLDKIEDVTAALADRVEKERAEASESPEGTQ